VETKGGGRENEGKKEVRLRSKGGRYATKDNKEKKLVQPLASKTKTCANQSQTEGKGEGGSNSNNPDPIHMKKRINETNGQVANRYL